VLRSAVESLFSIPCLVQVVFVLLEADVAPQPHFRAAGTYTLSLFGSSPSTLNGIRWVVAEFSDDKNVSILS